MTRVSEQVEDDHGQTWNKRRGGIVSGLILTLMLSGAATRPLSRNEKAFYADPQLVAFVRPGLTIKITSAADRAGWDDHCRLFPYGPARGAPGSHRSIDARRNFAQLRRRLYPGRPTAVRRLHYPERDRRGLRNGDPGGLGDQWRFHRGWERLPIHVLHTCAFGFRPGNHAHDRHLWIAGLD